MASEYDPSEFVDSDYQSARRASALGSVAAAAPAVSADARRAPSAEEVEARVTEAHTKLAELRRVQQDLERERSDLEEVRRRQSELTQGRQEMEQHLTRGIGLLEEAEFAARRDAEQMAKALADLKDALGKVQAIHEESWARDNFNTELTRALTAVENARMEWNSARLKFAILSGESAQPAAASTAPEAFAQNFLRERSYPELCKIGLALTWPIFLIGLAVVVVMLLRH
jgi:hypothetical protein